MSLETMKYSPASPRAWPAAIRAEEKDFRSRFSSRSHCSCQASRMMKVIFTTSAGPMLTGRNGNFSHARLPSCSMPKGVRSRRINSTLNAAIHFHRLMSISRSIMEMAKYTTMPISSAAVWTMIFRLSVGAL